MFNEKIYKKRLSKLIKLKDKNINIYEIEFKANISIKNFHSLFSKKDNEILKKNNKKFNLVGRILSLRKMGKIYFLNIKEQNIILQIFIKINDLDYKNIFFVNLLDIGDIIGVTGCPIKTKTNTLSILVEDLFILSKSLQQLPEKWHGLKKIELKYRYRYIDLIINNTSKNIFEIRSKIVNEIRNYLNFNEYIEVETPILNKYYNGASAKPFITLHNYLDEELFLRIAPELSLKKLLVGGFDKIFELGKTFRNESSDTIHNPEFTILEIYRTFYNYKEMSKFIESMFNYLLDKIPFCKKNVLKYIENNKLKFQYKDMTSCVFDFFNLTESKKKKLNLNYKILDICEYLFLSNVPIAKLNKINEYFNIIEKKSCDLFILKNKKINDYYIYAKKLDFFLEKRKNKKEIYFYLLNLIFEYDVSEKIQNPTFIYGYSSLSTPLAKKNNKKKYFVDRFELFIDGVEIANIFSELNDFIEQKSRFKLDNDFNNSYNKKIDKEFLNALSIGMPPAAGCGIGIDRLVMFLTGCSSIKDVIFFPNMR